MSTLEGDHCVPRSDDQVCISILPNDPKWEAGCGFGCWVVAVIECSVTAAPITRSGAGVGCLAGGTARARRLEPIVLNPPRMMSVGSIESF